ncbi:MAG: thiamine-binding protein [Candidatus Latescibacterota bacterium]|nr:MAG: thiamine-binding protein [Candidatus Latescibacterota bacterium]RKY74344.1 MAG: thiamine-binding protein [Candidatus Latescibacterota bacterium]
MAVAEISVVPLGTGSPSVSRYVAKALEVVRASGLKYELTPMATVVEGSVEEILKLVGDMHRAVLEDAVRVVTSLRMDDRRDKPLTMEGKVRAVEGSA